MNAIDNAWRARTVRPPFPWGRLTMRPADVTNALKKVMLDRSNSLEDASYTHVVPNHYIVEVGESNYQRNYQPIERQILHQWSSKLLEALNIANNRQGRRLYRFSGRVRIEIRPSKALTDSQARILSRIEPDQDTSLLRPEDLSGACLVMTPGDRRWHLRRGTTILGRNPNSDIYLDMPVVQETRLISGHHAYIQQKENGQMHLYDGSPEGKPSVNGTYVNNQRVGPEGVVLQPGDLILLAALRPDQPRPDTPGVVVLRFEKECA